MIYKLLWICSIVSILQFIGLGFYFNPGETLKSIKKESKVRYRLFYTWGIACVIGSINLICSLIIASIESV